LTNTTKGNEISPYDGETWLEFAWQVENEGFDYFFTQYSSLESFAPGPFRDIVKAYREASEALKFHLREACGEEGPF
jgi:hypothetical protein